ncbi:MAG TPA: GxxExxY protein [Pyrinomonadaceae bacterium]
MDDGLLHRDLTDQIIGVFYDVYNELGYGFLESIYEDAMVIALQEAGLTVEQQVPVPVWFRGVSLGTFEADLLVNRSVIIELKAVKQLAEVHVAQLMHYLRATEIEVGLVMNFGDKPEFKRRVFDNSRKGLNCAPVSLIENLFS